MIRSTQESEKDAAEKIYWRLTSQGLKIFWDRECLKDGENWEASFLNGLMCSRHIITLISEKGVARWNSSFNWKDNLLMEWELAVDRLDVDPKCIVPVFVGQYVVARRSSTSEASGFTERQTLMKFQAFDGPSPDERWPDSRSLTCSARTIGDTMHQLFATFKGLI